MPDKYSIGFALNTCACVLCVFNTEKSNKTEFVKYIVYASAYFAGSVLILILTDRERIVALSFIIYAAAMIFGRVLSIRHKHKTANSVLNIIMIVIWAILCLGVILTGSLGGSLAAVILGITVPVQLLIRTIQLSFSHIRYDMVHISTYGLLPRYSELRKPKAPCGELLLYVRT